LSSKTITSRGLRSLLAWCSLALNVWLLIFRFTWVLLLKVYWCCRLIPDSFLIFIFINLSHVNNWSICLGARLFITLELIILLRSGNRTILAKARGTANLCRRWAFEYSLSDLAWSWCRMINKISKRSLLQITLPEFNTNLVKIQIYSWWDLINLFLWWEMALCSSLIICFIRYYMGTFLGLFYSNITIGLLDTLVYHIKHLLIVYYWRDFISFLIITIWANLCFIVSIYLTQTIIWL
jgi:hypothetical protein